VIEHGVEVPGLRALQRALDGPVELVKPSIPATRGALTVADVVASCAGTTAYTTAVDAWAHSVWDAYGPLHETAQAWIQRAFVK
jgi:hypothetical protein